MLRARFAINANSPPLSLGDGDAFPAVLPVVNMTDLAVVSD